MPKEHYKLIDAAGTPDRWWLGTPYDLDGNEVDPDSFGWAQRLNPRLPLSISLRYDGIPMDFTFADFGVPVVNLRTRHILEEFALSEFQTFPATIEGCPGDYFAVNFLDVRKCVDESQSEFLKWTEADNRPDKLGKFRQITKLRIDPVRAGDADIFRLEDFKVILIVSERLQRAFTQADITGVSFRPVG